MIAKKVKVLYNEMSRSKAYKMEEKSYSFFFSFFFFFIIIIIYLFSMIFSKNNFF